MEISAVQGGGDRRLLANTIKNVHIVFVNPSPLKC